MKNGRRCHAGQSLVELALVLPLLITILSAVLHYGVLFWLQISLESGIREAATFIAYRSTSTPIDVLQARTQAVLRASLPSFLDLNNVAVTVSAPSGFTPGNPLEVTANYPIQLLKSLPFGAIIPVPTDIDSRVVVPIIQ